MVSNRRGAGKIGCLFMLLVATAIGYYGYYIGEAYWNAYQFQDAMKAEAKFASHRSDAVIKRRIVEFADSLGLPDDAKVVTVRRGDHMIFIFADYMEHVELPGFKRDFHMNPTATGTF